MYNLLFYNSFVNILFIPFPNFFSIDKWHSCALLFKETFILICFPLRIVQTNDCVIVVELDAVDTSINQTSSKRLSV
ncbi:MAG: hypothetical protein IJ756_05125 [Paludibacteraceae bacterium]|nr:hypothetical protein [Paludibacteraceae bacterium]